MLKRKLKYSWTTKDNPRIKFNRSATVKYRRKSDKEIKCIETVPILLQRRIILKNKKNN